MSTVQTAGVDGLPRTVSRTRRNVALAVLVALLFLAGQLVLFRALRQRARPHEPETVEVGPDANGRTPREAEALRRYARPGLRPARDDDADTSDERDELYDIYVEYHPYFVRGDLNNDGVIDFAQAFVETRSGTSRFHIAVFFGRPDGTFAPPVFAERDTELAAGDIAVERSVLIVTPDLGSDEVHRWRFDSSDRRFHEVPTSDENQDEEEEAPGGSHRQRT